MRRLTTTCLLLALCAVFTLGWTTEDPPTGDTTTVQRGDVIYADEGSTIQVYKAKGNIFELVRSIETDQEVTHDHPRRSRKKHSHGTFSCSCSHSHDHGRHHHDHDHDPCDPCYSVFAASGDELAYVYERTTVVTLDISTPDDPRELSRVDVGWEVTAIEVVGGAFVVVGDTGREPLDTFER